MDNNIDIVVTWVDENDSSWKASYNKYKRVELVSGVQQENNLQAFGKERTRDWGLFKYWFRAVEQNCPWVRKVFLVIQKESQLPKWLDKTNPKLRIVYHNEFIPQEFLPTFNSTIIQSFFYRIPDLSEYYIRSDDDCYFLNSINESMFYKNGQPVQYLKKLPLQQVPIDNGFSNVLNNAINLFGSLGYTEMFEFTHLPELRSKSIEGEFIKTHQEEIYASMLKSKFRLDTNICSIFYLWLFKASNIGIIDNSKYNNSKAIFLAGDEDFNKYSNLDIVCFNDTQDTKNINQCKQNLLNFFQNKFPYESSFEKITQDALPLNKDGKAWLCFLSTDNYIYYVLNLYKCLLDVKSKYPLYCGITKNVSQKTVDILKKCGLNILTLDTAEIEDSNLIKRSAANGMSTRYLNALTKLALLKFDTLFKKVVYLDVDLHIFENIDELFDKPHMSAVEDLAPVVKHPKYYAGLSVFCSGTFIWDFEHNKGLGNKIIRDLDLLPKSVGQWHDQNILNFYYQDWQLRPELHLNMTYGLMISKNVELAFEKSTTAKNPKVRHYVQDRKQDIPFNINSIISANHGAKVSQIIYDYYKSCKEATDYFRNKYKFELEQIHLENIIIMAKAGATKYNTWSNQATLHAVTPEDTQIIIPAPEDTWRWC